jgi:hypothetical protein
MTMIEGLLLAIFFALMFSGWHLRKISEHVSTIRNVVWKSYLDRDRDPTSEW